MDDSEKPYTVHSATKITLSPEAREICKLQNISERDMARHLLNQHKLEQSGYVQKDGEN